MNIPTRINDMEVVQYGATANREFRPGRFVWKETDPAQAVVNVAICRSPNGIGYWTTFCADDWTCITAEFGDTLLAAQLAADCRSENDIEWRYPGFAAERFIPIAQKYLALSIVASILISIIGFLPVVGPPIATGTGIVTGVVSVACLLMIWGLVGYVGVKAGGWLYGILHFLLVVLLTPILLVGPFIIPHLLASDLTRRREWEEERRNPSTSPA